MYVYGEMEEGGGGFEFHYYPKTGGEPVYNLDIPELFDVDEPEFEQLNDQLFPCLRDLWNEYKESGQELWSTLTMIINQGKFKIEFGYEDLSEGDSFERRLAWRYHRLGLVPKGSYSRKVLDEYLKKKESGQER